MGFVRLFLFLYALHKILNWFILHLSWFKQGTNFDIDTVQNPL